MPEFIMEGRDHAARAEAPFVLGFIEAMFFTDVEPSVFTDTWDTPENQSRREEGQISDLPGDVGYTDLHPETLKDIRVYCLDWQAKADALLTEAYATGYEEVQAGRDLWFTMNGHGTGFWDKGFDELTKLARYHEAHPYYEAPFVCLEL